MRTVVALAIMFLLVGCGGNNTSGGPSDVSGTWKIILTENQALFVSLTHPGSIMPDPNPTEIAISLEQSNGVLTESGNIYSGNTGCESSSWSWYNPGPYPNGWNFGIDSFAFDSGISSTIQKRAECRMKLVAPQSVFEDDRIRVEIPAGWSVEPITEHVSGDTSFELPIGALLTKGEYRLYLLSHQQQGSGIEGGRFAEVAQYISPWINMSESPWLPCPFATQGSEALTDNPKLARQDLYFDTEHASKKALADCGHPSVKGTLWYGSYFVETCNGNDTPRACGGFFLTYKDFSGKSPQPRTVNGSTTSDEGQMVYTMTVDTKTPDTLPVKNDLGLLAVLREASGIVGSILYK